MDEDLIICWSVTVSENNGLLPFFADYWMLSTVAISYIFSKFEGFFYLGPQLIILTLQAVSVSL